MSDSMEHATKAAALRDGVKRLDNQDLQKSGFWIGQISTMLATIIGVYLAAQAGLKQAIEFDDLQTRQNNYFLRSALYDEVKDNIKRLHVYNNEALSQQISLNVLKRQNPNIDTYVWDTMKYSEYTLATPSFYLTETRRFYANTKDIIKQVEAWSYGAKHASKLLTTELEHMENNVLPKMKGDIDAVAAYLLEHDMDVISIKGETSQ